MKTRKGQMKIMQMTGVARGTRLAGQNSCRILDGQAFGSESRNLRYDKGGQMKIMQMTFMILGVFLFFILVGLFFLNIVFKDVRGSAEELAREQAISSIEIIAGMPELDYGSRYSMTVDEDKLRVLSGSIGEEYGELWPIASIEVYKVYPAFESVVKCPAVDCNYYEVYNSGQKNVEKFSSYVSICKRSKEKGSAYDRCEIGKMVVGRIVREVEE